MRGKFLSDRPCPSLQIQKWRYAFNPYGIRHDRICTFFSVAKPTLTFGVHFEQTIAGLGNRHTAVANVSAHGLRFVVTVTGCISHSCQWPAARLDGTSCDLPSCRWPASRAEPSWSQDPQWLYCSTHAGCRLPSIAPADVD